MDVDDDDEYTNAAAAHAAFVMTVSAASMYCLLRHTQHARDINIHKLHPLPEKNPGLGRSADFLHRGTPLLHRRRWPVRGSSHVVSNIRYSAVVASEELHRAMRTTPSIDRPRQ